MSLIDTLDYKPVELAFGTSGLRGLARDMTDLECYINTSGFLQFLKSSGGLADGDKIYIAGDLRESTPRVANAVAVAVRDTKCEPVYCGNIPTPALAYYAQTKNSACVMVTGSHIPADRNGIKFYKPDGEVLKSDELAIKQAVADVRQNVYDSDSTLFDKDGQLKDQSVEVTQSDEAEKLYEERNTFGDEWLAGKQIVFYEHSAVGRDLVTKLLEKLGAEVIRVDRSDVFVSIDTENVTAENREYFKSLASSYPDNFAIFSTDGDSDRPFVVDETGEFQRGDMVGCVVAEQLKPDFVAVPISSNDAVDTFLKDNLISFTHTKIGSPYVIEAMKASGQQKSVGWEVNGGFLVGSDVDIAGKTFEALPTRDALLPILLVLYSAVSKDVKVSQLFSSLPKRYTGAGLLDGVDETAIGIIRNLAQHKERVEKALGDLPLDPSLGEVTSIDYTDGLRMKFSSGDIVHIRASGNAPQLRVYTNTNSQDSANQLADSAIQSDGVLEKFIASLS